MIYRGHLYRHHRCFQCERCGDSFKNEDFMKQHSMAIKACQLKPFEYMEGITNVIEKQLRSRKKAHTNQTPEERWRDIYRILFPMESVPSPCKFHSFNVTLTPTIPDLSIRFLSMYLFKFFMRLTLHQISNQS